MSKKEEFYLIAGIIFAILSCCAAWLALPPIQKTVEKISASVTPSSTNTLVNTYTPPPTKSMTPTLTQTLTYTPTWTPTFTSTHTFTPTFTLMPSLTPSITPVPSATADFYKVTFVNHSTWRMRISEVGEIAPQNLITVNLSSGLHAFSIETYNSFWSYWSFVGNGLQVDMNSNLLIDCYYYNPEHEAGCFPK